MQTKEFEPLLMSPHWTNLNLFVPFAIVCFNNKYNQVSVGDTIVGVNTLEKVRVGHIKSLQIDKKSAECISSEVSVDFGAKVSFHASDQYSYYIIK